MNPGLVVKLRPSGPWRIGPDSGARNRVDLIYHSDSLFSAVTAAMARMGLIEEWLDATARHEASAVSFSSCFPFLDEIGFVVPPRSVWPPSSPALLAARVRWKSARFVPLGIVQALLAGQTLDENHWTVDGASQCLVPAGRPGPFRTGTRWSAAVDRLTGATERHSTACIEFRPGSGLWTIVGFRDEAAHERWIGPVKAAFRLLADTGMGGERSRGWGRSEPPEFIDGSLPEMILPEDRGQERGQGPEDRGQGTGAGGQEEVVPAVDSEAPSEAPSELEVSEAAVLAGSDVALKERGRGPGAGGQEEVAPASDAEPPSDAPSEPEVSEAAVLVPSDVAPLKERGQGPRGGGQEEVVPANDSEPEVSEAAVLAGSDVAPLEAALETDVPVSEPELAAQEPSSLASDTQPEPVPGPEPPAPGPSLPAPGPRLQAYWLLSLFAPAPSDSVDWQRGNYAVLIRGGRIESPAASGDLKKQVNMVAEGSVLYAGSGLCGAAPDVAPDGFAHPVFRAGFALSIPLPEVR